MNKKELQTLTIEQLNGMTEQALKAVADEVIGHHKDGAVFDYMEGLVGSDVWD